MLKSCHALQIEQHAEVRAALPTPQQGQLPLPEGLPSAMLQCNPQVVEDLNVVVPKGSQQLSSQELNDHVSPPFMSDCPRDPSDHSTDKI